MTRSIPSECEAIIGGTNADKGWGVYVDEHHRFFRLLVGLACAWGVEPRRLGSGVEFELPWRALRLAKPPSERRRRASRESLQKARLAPRNALRKGAAKGSPAEGDAEPVPAPGEEAAP